jgi:uncharacterized membrane protein
MGQLESLDSDEGLARRRHRHWYDRLMMLSDGVFAIAITLLAAEIAPLTAPGVSLARLWGALMPQLDAYALSVVVICIFWLAHRRFMAMILTVDAPLTVITLIMLALVALVPAATRMADLQHGSSPAMTIYGGLVIAIGIACAALWGYAALLANLVSDEAPKAQRWFYFALILLTPPLFLAITGTLQRPPPGAVPLTLVLLFLIGWPMRLWIARRLEAARSTEREAEPES